MTTIPLDPADDAPVRAPALGPRHRDREVGGNGRRPARPSTRSATFWHLVLHPVRWWEGRGHRYLPGAWFPVVVFAVWRAAHLVAIVLLERVGGSTVIETSLFYDGERYQRIMQFGYATFGNPSGTTEMPNSAFFPLVSWLATPIYTVTRSIGWSSQIVANVTAFTAFLTVWGLSKAWKGEVVARRAVLLLALIPASLYLWQFYSEALFITLAAGGLWADRRGRRAVAAICFFGLATTRSIGFLVPGVLVAVRVAAPLCGRAVDRVWARSRPEPPTRRPVDWATLGYLASAAAGLAVVMVVLWEQAGDPLAFMNVQKDWGRGLSAPWTSIESGFRLLYPSGREIMIPALVSRNFDLWCVPIVFFAIGYAFISAAPAWVVAPGRSLYAAAGRAWRRWGNAWTVALGAGLVAAVGVTLVLARSRIHPRFFLFVLAPLGLILLPLALCARWARRDPYPPETWLIGAALIALPLCSSVLPSFNRFVMADFIIYPVYASLLARVPGKARVACYLALAALCLWTVTAMLGRISVNRFVG